MSQNNIGIDLNMKTRMARDKTSGLAKGFVQLSKDGKAANTSIIGMTNSLSTLSKVISTVGLYKLARGLGQAVSAAADIRESVHMYNVAMGDFAESTAEAVFQLTELSGLDPIKTLDSVGEFNLLARSMGVTSSNSAVLSENINRLALDLSSLTNRDILKVQEDFKSGLLGRSRTVYKYGIDITEAALAQEALNQGISKSVRHMSQAEKMQLRYQIMIRTTALAHGDFAQTIESPANQMRIFSERILTATRSLGTIFIPMLTKVMPYLNAFAKMLNYVFQALAKLVGYDPKVNEAIKNTGDVFGDSTGQLEDGIEDAGDSAKDTTKKVDKLKKKVQQLAGFDELNILGKHETPEQPTVPKIPKPGKGGSGTGGPLDFNLEGYDSMIDGIKQKSDEIFEKMLAWMKKVQEAAKPTTDALVKLWNEGLKELRQFSGQALSDFYHEFLVPVAKWTLGEEGLARFFNVVNDMLLAIDWKSLNEDLKGLFQALVPFATAIGTGLIDFFEYVYAPFVVWTYNDALPRIITAVTDALNRVDWENVNEKLKVFFKQWGQFRINAAEVAVSFLERFLIPLSEWTIGTGFPALMEILANILFKVKWTKIHDSFNKLWDALTPFAVKLGEGLLWFVDNVLGPLGLWVANDLLPTFLDLLANAIDFLLSVWKGSEQYFSDFFEYLIKPLASFVGNVILINFLEGVSLVLETLGKVVNKYPYIGTIISSIFTGIVLGLAGGKVLSAIKNLKLLSKATKVFSFLMSPTGLVVLGITAVVVVAGLLIKHWDKVKEGFEKISKPIGKVIDWFSKMAIGVSGFASGAVKDIGKFNIGGIDSISDMAKKSGKWIADFAKDGKEKVSDMSKKVKGWFGDMGTDTKKSVKDMKEKFSDRFRDIRDDASKKAEKMKEKVVGFFGGMKKDSGTETSSLKTNVGTFFTNMRTDVEEKSRKIKEYVVGKFGDMKRDSDSPLGSLVTLASEKFSSMKENIGGFVTDMVDSIKKMPGRMADGIRNGAGALKSAFVNMWNAAVNGIRTPVNAIIGGANWILEKFNAPKLGLWKVPNLPSGGGGGRNTSTSMYARGTDAHPGGHAIVNDQAGPNYEELIEFPNGKRIIPKGRNVFMPNMPKGTKVLPADITKNLPHYKGGVGNWFKSKLGGIWDFVKKPFDLVSNVIKDRVNFGKLTKTPLDMAKGMVKRVTTPMVDWTKGLFKKNEDKNPANIVPAGVSGAATGVANNIGPAMFGGVGFPAPPFRQSSPYGWRMHPILKRRILHGGTDLAAPSGTPVNAQIGGTVNHAGVMGSYGNMVRISQGRTEQLYAHLSRILTKRGASVKAGQRIGLVGSTGRSTGPHLHYEKRINGRPVHPGNPLYNSRNRKSGSLSAVSRNNKYAKGGFIGGITPFNVAGEAGNEGIVPLEGRHMMPFADAIAERLTSYTQKAIKDNGMKNNNNGGVIVQIGERTIVDVLSSELNRKSKINGKSVIRI